MPIEPELAEQELEKKHMTNNIQILISLVKIKKSYSDYVEVDWGWKFP